MSAAEDTEGFGLSSRELAELHRVLEPYRHIVTKACIFGSRATGRYRRNSDIDLVLYGELSSVDIGRLRGAFEESSLVVPVDIIAYDLLADPEVRAHIDRAAKVLFYASSSSTT